MSLSRKAYLLTTDLNGERCINSKKLLEDLGFTVIPFKAVWNINPLEGDIKGHRGLIFQNRLKYPSTLDQYY